MILPGMAASAKGAASCRVHMKKEWVPSQEAFDALLNWLDPNRERAGQKYETIRLRLIKIFECRGCRGAEELADESINRVTAKVVELVKTYEGDPSLYFYGVAHNLHLEYVRQSRVMPPPQSVQPPVAEDDSSLYECLEQCMNKLSAKPRDLVLRYYQEDKRAKIDGRKQLASEWGVGINALRIRAHRIRVQLQKCVESCMEQILE
jgi:DNA-directed RNA polymerase specialized sigma24 family protein